MLARVLQIENHAYAELFQASSDLVDLSLRLSDSSSAMEKLLEDSALMEKEKQTLNDMLIKEVQTSTKLNRRVEELQLFILILGEDLSRIDSLLLDSNAEYEKQIAEFKSSLLMAQADMSELQRQLDESISRESHMNEKLVQINTEKSQESELKIKDLENMIASLSQEISIKTNLLAEADLKALSVQTEYEGKFEASKKELSLSLQQYEVLNSLLEESLLNEDNFKAKLNILETEKLQLDAILKHEIENNHQLESRVAELDECVMLLNDKVQFVSKELESEKENMSLKENKLKELQDQLYSTHFHCEAIQNQLNESIANEAALKTKLFSSDKDKNELIASLNAQTEKDTVFKSNCDELDKKIQLMNEKLASKSSELEKCKEELLAISEYQVKVCELEKKLNCSEAQLEEVHNQLNEAVSNINASSIKLASSEEQNKNVIACLNVETDKVNVLECSIRELNDSLDLLKDELIVKSLEIAKLQENTTDYEVKTKELETQLVSLEDEIGATQNLLNKCSANEANLKDTNSALEIKVVALNECLKSETEKVEVLELDVEEWKTKALLIEEELSLKMSDFKKITHSLPTVTGYQITDEPENILENLSMQMNNVKQIMLCDFINESSSVQVANLSVKKATDNFAAGRTYDLKMWSVDILHCFSVLENLALTKYEKCKFLYSNQLISKKQLKKLMHTALLLRKRFFKIQKFKALVELISSITKLGLVTEQMKIGTKLNIPVSNLLGQTENQKNSMETFFQICEYNYKQMSCFITEKLQKYNNNMRHYCVFLQNYENIHKNTLFTINQNTEFVLYQYKIGGIYVKTSFNPLPIVQQLPLNIWNQENQCKMGNELQILDAKDASNIINFYSNLIDSIADFLESSNKKCCTGALKNFICSPPFKQSLILFFHLFNRAKKLTILEELRQWIDYSDICSSDELISHLCITFLQNDFSSVNFSTEEKCAKSSSRTNEPFSKMDEICHNCTIIQEEKEALELTIQQEKNTQRLLNCTIEEIEEELGLMFRQKTKLQNTVLEIGQMLNYLKSISLHTKSFAELEFDYNFNNQICLCEMCIIELEKEELCIADHEMLLAENFAKCMKDIINKGQEIENVLKELKHKSAEAKYELSEFETNTNELQNNLQEISCDRAKLKSDLLHAEKKCESAYALLNEKDAIISDLESEKIEFSNFFEQCKDKLQSCESQLCKLSIDKDAFKQEIISKEEDIKIMQKKIQDQDEILKAKLEQSREREIHIAGLENTVSKIEEQLSHLRDDKNESDKLVIQLQDKMESLQKTNDSLNLTIEDIEKELQNCFTENQNLEDKLKNLVHKADNIGKDVITWKDMYESEKKYTNELTTKMQSLEKNKVEADLELNNFKNLHSALEKDIYVLKNLQREHENTIIVKNLNLKEKDDIIKKLHVQFDEAQNSNAEHLQLAQSESLLKSQLKEADELISKLEKKIEEFEENNTLKQKILRDVESQKEELEKEICSYKLKLENLIQEVELLKNENSDLNIKWENTKVSLNKETEMCSDMKKEISLKEELIDSLNASLEERLAETAEIIINLKKENEKLKDGKVKNNKKITDLTKDIISVKSALASLETKNTHLCDANNKLLMEIKIKNENSLSQISNFKETKHALSKATKFIKCLINLILEKITDCSTSGKLQDYLKSMQVQLNQSTSKIATDVDFPLEVLESLKVFFDSNFRNTDEELKIISLISSIGDSVNNVKQFVELFFGNEKIEEFASHKTFNFADNSMNITFNETCLLGNIGDRTKYSHSEVLKELQQTQGLLQEYFNVLKNIVQQQAKEMKDLKLKLSQSSMQVSSVDSKESIEQLKKKYKFLRLNNHNAEEHVNKLKRLCSEQKEQIGMLEKRVIEESELKNKIEALNDEKARIENDLQLRIENLEKEKAGLDREADELADDYKKLESQRYKDLATLMDLKEKLKQCEKENESLKSHLEKFYKQPVGKENRQLK